MTKPRYEGQLKLPEAAQQDWNAWLDFHEKYPKKRTTKALYLHERFAIVIRLLVALVQAEVEQVKLEKVLELFYKDWDPENFYVPSIEELGIKIDSTHKKYRTGPEKRQKFSDQNYRETVFREIREKYPDRKRLDVIDEVRRTVNRRRSPIKDNWGMSLSGLSRRTFQNTLPAARFP